jgi:hypothetical protein
VEFSWVHTAYAPLAEEARSIDNREYLMRLSDGSEHRCGRTYARPLGKIGSLLGNLAEMSKLETFTAQGAFTPVLAKHSKSFSLVGAIAVGVAPFRSS